MDYGKFLERKAIVATPSGFEPSDLHPEHKPFQKALVTAACRAGKFAKFAFTGAGKTFMECSWADQVARNTKGGRVLGFMPLAVAHQTVEEGSKFGFDVNFCESADDVRPGINVTNYDKMHKFTNDLDGVFFDEASILKDASSRTFQAMREFIQPIRYRLSATATPSPNDFVEFTTQSEILGVMPISEAKATFFRHDGGDTSKWRLSGWGEEKFWEFLASWSILIRKPSDLGFDDEGYILPPLDDQYFVVDGNFQAKPGELVSVVQSMQDRRNARKGSIDERCQFLADIINNSTEQHLVWCELNDEADLLEKLIPDALQVAGKHTDKQKVDRMMDFTHGNLRVLISKPKICGWGMNWQNCHNVDFVGIDDSWEKRHQATNRCYRFGQSQTVTRRTIYSIHEQPVLDNLTRKQQQAERLGEEMFKVYQRLGVAQGQVQRRSLDYNPQIQMRLPEWLVA